MHPDASLPSRLRNVYASNSSSSSILLQKKKRTQHAQPSKTPTPTNIANTGDAWDSTSPLVREDSPVKSSADSTSGCSDSSFCDTNVSLLEGPGLVLFDFLRSRRLSRIDGAAYDGAGDALAAGDDSGRGVGIIRRAGGPGRP